MNFSNVVSAAEAQPHRLIDADIEPECIATIVLPVRNEAEFLPKNLESFARQIDLNNRPFDSKLFEIIVFLNNCDDDSAEFARRWQRKNRHLNVYVAEAKIRPENANIGFVRRLLMTEANERLRRNRTKGGVILTTDADTTVAPNWLAANLREIKNGADAVGGRILIKADELKKMSPKARRFHLLDTDYRLLTAEIEARLDYVAHDYMPRHHQHFNASFAVTTAAFARAGGVPRVRFLEDVAFYQALLRVDARFRHSPKVTVETSSRQCGRTEMGLSTQLKEWKIMGEKGDELQVESVKAIEERIRLRKSLRFLWRKAKRYHVFRSEISSVSDKLLVSENFVSNQLNAAQTFGSLYEKILREQAIIGEWAKKFPDAEAEQSLFHLRNLAKSLRRETALAARAF
ncbi:MAG: glycosyltransferase family A protein [Pyrinomonadaceae bacterium]